MQEGCLWAQTNLAGHYPWPLDKPKWAHQAQSAVCLSLVGLAWSLIPIIMDLVAVLLLREKNCHPRAAVPVYFQVYLQIKWMPTKSHHNDAGFMPLFIFWPLKKYRTRLGSLDTQGTTHHGDILDLQLIQGGSARGFPHRVQGATDQCSPRFFPAGHG